MNNDEIGLTAAETMNVGLEAGYSREPNKENLDENLFLAPDADIWGESQENMFPIADAGTYAIPR
jgi:hypothetical protein